MPQRMPMDIRKSLLRGDWLDPLRHEPPGVYWAVALAWKYPAFRFSVSTPEGALRRRFTTKRCHARRKGIPFTLSFEYYRGLFEQQAGKDGYTGEQMSFAFGQGISGETGSLDRIDNAKGYMRGNCKFCRLATNSKKKGKPVEQFLMQLSLNFSESN